MTKSRKTTSRPPKRTVHILLIEDEPTIIRAARRGIREQIGDDSMLIIATTIDEALEELSSNKEFGVIFFDYSLPASPTRKTSIDLIKIARRAFGNVVWMFSTTSQSDCIEPMLAAGCQTHVSKKMIPWAAKRAYREYLTR